jgi:hypothetical protein
MNITPDQADRLEQEATGGRWGIEQHGPEYFPQVFAYHREDGLLLSTPITDNGIVEDGDARLIAAAPDLAQTIAGMTEEWGVQVKERTGWVPVGIYSPDLLWAPTRESAEYVASGIHKSLETRLVRRLVGPVEEAE